MGKLNIGGGSPLKLRFEDNSGNSIDTIEINGTSLQAKKNGWFETNIDASHRDWHGETLPVFRVTDIGKKEATIEFRSAK